MKPPPGSPEAYWIPAVFLLGVGVFLAVRHLRLRCRGLREAGRRFQYRITDLWAVVLCFTPWMSALPLLLGTSPSSPGARLWWGLWAYSLAGAVLGMPILRAECLLTQRELADGPWASALVLASGAILGGLIGLSLFVYLDLLLLRHVV